MKEQLYNKTTLHDCQLTVIVWTMNWSKQYRKKNRLALLFLPRTQRNEKPTSWWSQVVHIINYVTFLHKFCANIYSSDRVNIGTNANKSTFYTLHTVYTFGVILLFQTSTMWKTTWQRMPIFRKKGVSRKAVTFL